MGNCWEKKGKEANSLNKKTGGNNTKPNFIQQTPKVEEVLPLKQMKEIYNTGKNKENRKPVEKAKVQENGTKKVQKKPEKPQEPPKPKPPKSIESALNSINIEDFKSCFENSKRLFPDGPLIWLKDMVHFLNQAIPIEVQDSTFSTRPEGYPFSIVPTPIRNIIEKSVKDAGKSNAQIFLDISLTTMANDMSKNLNTVGHKLYIQYLALNEPQFVLTNMNKHLSLRSSYQNRQQIGLSILWGLGQAGMKDFNVGLKVFQELMLPLVEMKNYSRYVIQYLTSLVKHHNKMHINADQYLLILDVAFANYKNFPNDLRQEMQKTTSHLEAMLMQNIDFQKYHTFIEPLLKKLLSNNSKKYRDEINKVLTTCLTKDQTACGAWSKLYTKYLQQSAILLNYLDANWTSVSKNFNKTVFSNLLNTYSVANEELSLKKRKELGLTEAVTAIKNLTEKMEDKHRSGFPYKFFSFIVVAVIGGMVYYDIKQHGSWDRSRTYVGLKESGVLGYTKKAVDRSHEGLQWLHLRIDEQIPGYYEATADYLEVYVQLSKNLAVIGCNIFNDVKDAAIDKYPSVVASIEPYAVTFAQQSQKVFGNVWSTSVLYYTRSIDYLKTEVFVGQLAPENMQRVVYEAFNTTQQKAVECYQWIYEKVQSTMK